MSKLSINHWLTKAFLLLFGATIRQLIAQELDLRTQEVVRAILEATAEVVPLAENSSNHNG